MLTSIYIKGFKSFCHTLCLPVDARINIFIGPNGCGKSNIFDAFLWVLGEQSTKKLRGDMQRDLIFSGTSKRKPLGMAEVALEFRVFDRESNSELPMTIARRIFRNDESTYLLNNTPTRLHLIQRKLRALDMTLSPYTFITQGNVESLLSKKPHELQQLFEEIADIHRYKKIVADYTQSLTEKTVEFTVIKQKKDQIEEQLHTLKTEAEQAKLHQDLTQQKRTLQKETQVLEFRLVFEKLNTRLMKKVELQKNLSQLTTEYQTTHTLEQDHYRNMERINADFDIWSKAYNNNAQKKRDLTNQSLLLKERIALNQKEIQRLEKELAGKKQRYAALDIGLRKATKSLEEATGRLQKTKEEARGLDGDIAAQEQAYKRLQTAEGMERAKTDAKRNELRKLQQTLEQTNRAIWQDLSRQKQEAEQSSALDKERATIQREHRDMVKKQQEAMQKESRVQQELAAMVRRLETKHAEMRALSAKMQDNAGALAGTLSRLSTLETLSRQSTQSAGALLAEMQPQGCLGLFHQVFRVPEEQAELVDAFLGPLNNALVFSDEAAMKRCLERLREEQKPDCYALTCLQRLTSRAALPLAYQEQTFYLGIRPDRLLALQDILAQPGAISAQACNLDGVFVLHNPLQRHQAKPFTWRHETEKLKETQKALKGTAKTLREQEERCAGEIKSLETAATALRHDLQETKSALHGFAQLLTRMEADRQKLDAKRDLLRQAADKRERSSAKLAGEKQRIEEHISATTQELALQEAALARAEKQSGACKKALDALSMKQREMSFTLRELQKNRRLYEQSIREYKNTRYETELVSEELRGNLDKREELIETLVQQSEYLDQDMLSLQGHLKEARDKRNHLEQSRDKQHQELRKVKEAACALQQQVDTCSQSIHRLELDIARYKTQMEMTKQAFIQAGHTEDALFYTELEIKLNDSALTGYKHRLAQVEQQLADLGPINSLAIDGYARESKRYEDYLSQCRDMLEAMGVLNETIDRTNKKAVAQYVHAVTEVETHFKSIYTRFFDGGTARILLRQAPDNDNLIGLPVPELVIRPPGKRVSKISLLSGGEKALSSIALLFAFFLYKPSPFCFLDEVDAALDDVNTERFVSLLREFAKTTQFFIISHNRKTMACGQNIYGVTTQEKGVSKVLSISFSPAQEKG